jgi:hypothetical protein
MYIAGERSWASAGATFEAVDPATAEPFTAVALGDGTDVDRHRPVPVRNPSNTGALQNVAEVHAGGYHGRDSRRYGASRC